MPGEFGRRREWDPVAGLSGIGECVNGQPVAKDGQTIGRLDACARRGDSSRLQSHSATRFERRDPRVLGPILKPPVLSSGVKNLCAIAADHRRQPLQICANIDEKPIGLLRLKTFVVPINHVDGKSEFEERAGDLAAFPNIGVRIGLGAAGHEKTVS